ncbi:MAG: WG repeat-containing protein [Peptostreptococcaceae bacterium]|nr:WG repeat-containing protein [Peptostreptococcaceae bacterium]
MKLIKNLWMIVVFVLLMGCTVQEKTGEVKEEIDMSGFTELAYEVEIPMIEEGGLILVIDRKTDKNGFINMQGELVIPMEHGVVTKFSQGLCFSLDGQSGYYLDSEGNKVIEEVDGKKIRSGFEFDRAGQAIVRVDGKDGEEFLLIDTKGKAIDRYDKEDLEAQKITRESDPKNFSILNDFRPGKVYQKRRILDRFAKTTFYSDGEYFGIFSTEDKKFVTDLIYKRVGFFQNDRAIVIDKEGRMLLVDKEGNEILHISGKYSGLNFELYPFLSEEGFALNFLDEQKKAIILDVDGNEVKQTNYDYIGYFDQGIAKMGNVVEKERKKYKYGLINAKGEEILSPIYDNIGNIYEGKILVKANNKWYIGDVPGS